MKKLVSSRMRKKSFLKIPLVLFVSLLPLTIVAQSFEGYLIKERVVLDLKKDIPSQVQAEFQKRGLKKNFDYWISLSRKITETYKEPLKLKEGEWIIAPLHPMGPEDLILYQGAPCIIFERKNVKSWLYRETEPEKAEADLKFFEYLTYIQGRYIHLEKGQLIPFHLKKDTFHYESLSDATDVVMEENYLRKEYLPKDMLIKLPTCQDPVYGTFFNSDIFSEYRPTDLELNLFKREDFAHFSYNTEDLKVEGETLSFTHFAGSYIGHIPIGKDFLFQAELGLEGFSGGEYSLAEDSLVVQGVYYRANFNLLESYQGRIHYFEYGLGLGSSPFVFIDGRFATFIVDPKQVFHGGVFMDYVKKEKWSIRGEAKLYLSFSDPAAKGSGLAVRGRLFDPLKVGLSPYLQYEYKRLERSDVPKSYKGTSIVFGVTYLFNSKD